MKKLSFNSNLKKARVAILISEKIDFKTRNMTITMIKEYIREKE